VCGGMRSTGEGGEGSTEPRDERGGVRDEGAEMGELT
jgi:hypothetical protein